MQISNLEVNSKVVNLVGEVYSIEEPTEIAGGQKVQEGILADRTGQVKFSFWGDNVDKFKKGDKVILTSGWCKEFQGDLQVTTGKFGKVKAVPKPVVEVED